MTFTVTVDNREDEKYLLHLQKTFPDIYFEYKRITEGDYVSDHVMCERKTINDLWESVHDGRFHSQVNRMMTYNPDMVVVYLVVGSVEEWKFRQDEYYRKKIISTKVDPELIDSCIASLIVRENIRVICDTNELLGLNRVVKIMRRIELENIINMPSQRDPDCLAARLLNIKKKEWDALKKKHGSSLAYLSTLSIKDLMEVEGFTKAKATKVHSILQVGW